MANPFRIRSPRYPHYPATADEVIRMLGITNNRLPSDGMATTLIQGIRVYVAPRVPRPERRRNFALRVTAICPGCDRHLAASRLAQHTCKNPNNADSQE